MAEGDGDPVLLLAVSIVLAVVVAGCMKVVSCVVDVCLCVWKGLGDAIWIDSIDGWVDRMIDRSIDGTGPLN